MERFIAALCDEDLSVLIIEGTPSREELENAWLLILSEYQEIKGDSDEGSRQWKLSRDVKRLQHHLFIVEQCVLFLQEQYSESIAESLKIMGYRFQPKNTDPASYQQDLRSVVSRSKSRYLELKQLQKELKGLVNENMDSTPKRDYFDQMLIHIEEMQHAVYDMEILTVYKFLLLEKKFMLRIQQQEIKNALKTA